MASMTSEDDELSKAVKPEKEDDEEDEKGYVEVIIVIANGAMN